MDSLAQQARQTLTLLLQLAYSGELGAARAYAGHRASLSRRDERAALYRILRDELHHRHVLLAMLRGLGSGPDARRERKLNAVGRIISTFCLFGGWFAPMYGAGQLEAQNIGEYELAARLAHLAGLDELVEDLLVLAEVEWDHERVFRAYAERHWLWRLFPKWKAPPPREQIRATYAAFLKDPPGHVAPLRIPFLVR